MNVPIIKELQGNDNFDYVAFQYGVDVDVDVGVDKSGENENNDNSNANDGNVFLMIQFRPFSLHMWRTKKTKDENDMIEGEPIVSVNSDQLMHFEIRRSKDVDIDRPVVETDTANEIADADADSVHADRHGDKEIVGYWEDGLAIYADGTREEKREEIIDEHEAAAAEQRKLMEVESDTDNGEFKWDTEGMWEEKFKEHSDSKPYGPMSVGADISFPSSSHIFGLPEHASSAQLKDTTGANAHYREPYRLYNLDVFEYELDETMALYGEVPLIVSQSETSGTVGVFWFNPSETFVDVESKGTAGTNTHWISESGVFDLFLLPGPNPRSLYEQYARLTGRLSLPPMFSLGYHQCRWNYRDEDDVYQVHEKFEELDYPYDVLWLDIEHTDGKRYFTWDQHLFPDPMTMQKKLSDQGRKMVTIVDPHIKRDANYYIHKEATAKGLYIKDKTGEKDYDGWCWPGSSSYLDFTSAHVRDWWAEQFAYNRYIGSTSSLYTWNDMNEPSVFNGPEVSMQKDLRNLNGVEHREWHNLYGILFQKATAEGLVKRNEGENIRPFVLSRSFFAGSQRYGAIWTGDNESSWGHLEVAAPMLLSLNIGALSFVGADVGGFFGNPDAELMTRWMQAGAYQPFFRGHAHHDAKRREPWMFGDEWMVKMRRAAMARYALLPYWYTLFQEASVSGMPVMRTMWMEYPEIGELYHLDDQYLIGSNLLVKPVTGPGVKESTISFPAEDLWFDVDTMVAVERPMGHHDGSFSRTVSSDIDKIPVYQRGGSVIPRKLRLRRSTEMMTNDPYTLYIALDESQMASGSLYMDDEGTFNHVNGEYAMSNFTVDMNESIKCEVVGSAVWIDQRPSDSRLVERLVIMGLEKKPSTLMIGQVTLEFDYSEESKILVIRKPQVSALRDWSIMIQ
uniref:Glucosidase II subunit alpha n=2 Tax=Chaetoceros debilis TaxID=122233 RepID=A0A7S3VF80_9STRA